MTAETTVCCDTCLDRVIEGAMNFRDLGGLPAEGGRLRTGVLYRSGMTHRIAPEGLRRLADTYGLRTVIDLRTPAELVNDGLATWVEAGIAHRHIPVVPTTDGVQDEMRRAASEPEGTFDWAGLYARWLAGSGAAFRDIFVTLAQPVALPAVFHCAGGRDRTGVTAALLLGMLGVPDELIAHDYALTGAHLGRSPDRDQRRAKYAASMGVAPEQVARITQTVAESMLRLLDTIGATYGSVATYLDNIGVDKDVRETLRGALVEPAA